MGSERADILVVVESTSASTRAAFNEPITHLDTRRVAVLSQSARRDLVGSDATTHEIVSDGDLREMMPLLHSAVIVGDFLQLGALAHHATRSTVGRSFVVQHGLLTPQAPPLPKHATLLAWSEADGEFWRSGRNDVEVEVVGSQLLWHAAQRNAPRIDPASPPTFLGQLHGAEIPRREMARVSVDFCRAHNAAYRPHPSEVDKLSRAQHALWKRRGVRFDTSELPLEKLPNPIVGVFSTGVLEAAAAGNPAWVHHPNPPAWVRELWGRYGLSEFGSAPTKAPVQPIVEPAKRIAEVLMRATEDMS